jgi:hypothetical protein
MRIDPKEVAKMAKEVAKEIGEFAVPLVTGLVKLRDAKGHNCGCMLDTKEVKALMRALSMLNEEVGVPDHIIGRPRRR